MRKIKHTDTTAYTRIGEYHNEFGLPNQDAVLAAENQIAKIIVIADGVSSCKNSKKGAEIACRAVADAVLDDAEYIFTASKETTAKLMVEYIFQKLNDEAKATGESVESYSSTISFVCFNKISGDAMTFMLGDSLIYAFNDGELSLMCEPEFADGGTYTTTTRNAENCVDINFVSANKYSYFMLCTDGAWSLFYENGRMKKDVSAMVEQNDDKTLKEYFDAQECQDDCSCIIMNL
ncbi:MAG: protein phosphatase 2C domain-containing protein [Faecalibacterium sp.]|nr:protein phosphatase 2C domain-containing protein [Ruminococcus sp.]MCM1392397.1 protein phosphatase 2C domain-containing protein [Ruminococcus sp.]MCM1485897.1 protein phosphatase 2C domain-containing protein [Faecalibacterium sp.]